MDYYDVSEDHKIHAVFTMAQLEPALAQSLRLCPLAAKSTTVKGFPSLPRSTWKSYGPEFD